MYDLSWFLGTVFGGPFEAAFSEGGYLDETHYNLYLGLAQAELVGQSVECPDLYPTLLQLQMALYISESEFFKSSGAGISIDPLSVVSLVKKDQVDGVIREYETQEIDTEVAAARLPKILSRFKDLCKPVKMPFLGVAVGDAPCRPCANRRIVDQTTDGWLNYLFR